MALDLAQLGQHIAHKLGAAVTGAGAAAAGAGASGAGIADSGAGTAGAACTKPYPARN